MTDPVYGDNPIDPGETWDASFRPPLVLDPTWVQWRNVIVEAMVEFLDSQWLVRWRRATSTATGKQLADRGLELGWPKPVGWTDARYSAVLVAILPGIFSLPVTTVAYNVSAALIVPPQTFEFVEYYPNSALFEFTDTTADDAIQYLTALEYARPHGCQFYLVFHPDVLTTFKIDTSTLDGPDTLADMGISPP